MRRSLIRCAVLATLFVLPAQVHAQRSARGNVYTQFGQFSMQEMMAAGGDPYAAAQNRQAKQEMIYQQQVYKQQQQAMQQMAKQQKARQDYLKQHPEVAKIVAKPTPSTAISKAKPKTAKAKPATTGAAKESPRVDHVPGAPLN